MSYKARLRAMHRLREISSDAYFKELDKPWDGMEHDLHVAKAILFKHLARSGGSVRLIDDLRLPADGEGEAYVRMAAWWLEIIEELQALYSNEHEAEFRLHKVMNELVGKNMGRNSPMQ
jgi:hypothetical protein